MDFTSFLILLAISAVVAWILHFGLKYYVTAGWWSFGSKVVVGWFGAWLGTPIFGQWPPDVQYRGIFIIPAVIGAFAILVLAIDLMKMRLGKR
jgi:uncharacterized membrane protein YeaQ/YmgE (transglycosylase-associated protein family)